MSTTTSHSPIAPELEFLGARCRILADEATTDGRYGLIEMIELPANDMPPLHVHHAHDEGFLVLDGELTIYLPGAENRLRPGDFMLAPRGVPHSYRVGETPARLLVIGTPAGFEGFVRDVAALEELSPETLGAVAASHDIEILGPPGARP